MTGVPERMAAAAARLRARVAGVQPEFRTAADPATGERWDAGQVLAHCAEFVPYWVAQAQSVVERGGGGVPFGRVKSDPDRIAAIEHDRQTDPALLLDRLDAAVTAAATWYAGLSPADLALTGRHSTLGEMTVGRIAEHFLAEHLAEHAAQLD